MTKVPRYSSFAPASALASEIKRRTRRGDTKPEILLRRELWRLGLRFRVNVPTLPGKPDIVFARAKVVIFCDGDFWHGRDWRSRRRKLQRGANAPYWIAKISANIERDRRVSQNLRREGWTVLRYWETDILRSTAAIVFDIANALQTGLAGEVSVPAIHE